MIELAPGHKQGLAVASPVLLGAGSAGGGEATHPELDLNAIGAIVVGPVTLQSRAGAPMPRAWEVEGGLLLETGGQNRGLEATLREFGPQWKRIGTPVVVQLGETEVGPLKRMAERLGATTGVAGLELALPDRWRAEDVRRVVAPLVRAAELPLWVKLPLTRAEELGGACVDAGAAGLVVGQAPIGAAWQAGTLRRGALHGPGVFPLALDALARVAALQLPVALIASGGIHTVDQARQALGAGAHALQLDTVAWLEPAFPAALAAALGAR